MSFRATNFTVTVLLLVAFTIFMAYVRQRKSLENNWPILYWLLVVFFAIIRPEETFSIEILLVGLACGFLLRFEFMNPFFIKSVRIIEGLVFAYVIYRGLQIVLI
jgi:hypothetical protein